jgi:hypothetical protein
MNAITAKKEMLLSLLRFFAIGIIGSLVLKLMHPDRAFESFVNPWIIAGPVSILSGWVYGRKAWAENPVGRE